MVMFHGHQISVDQPSSADLSRGGFHSVFSFLNGYFCEHLITLIAMESGKHNFRSRGKNCK